MSVQQLLILIREATAAAERAASCAHPQPTSPPDAASALASAAAASALRRVAAARTQVAGTVFLFGVGCAAVASIVGGQSPRVTSAAAAGGLALYLLGWARADPGPWAAAALGGAVFPVLEALCIWLGARSCRPTWEYAPEARGFLGVPGFLWPLWACAGAFVVALSDGLAAVAGWPGPRQGLAEAAGKLALGFGPAMVAVVALIVWGGAWRRVAAGIAALAALALALLRGRGQRRRVLAAPAAAAAAVALVFPVLEAACVRATGTWVYLDRAALAPGLRVPWWLWPLWALNAAAFVQAATAARALRSSG